MKEGLKDWFLCIKIAAAVGLLAFIVNNTFFDSEKWDIVYLPIAVLVMGTMMWLATILNK